MVMKIKLVVQLLLLLDTSGNAVLSQNDEIIETYFPRSRPIFQGGGESLEGGFGNASRKIGIKPLKEIWT